ncbi:MAG: outer membrane beta-barrel family protein [Bacteroidales bacterium]|nr:outer membrane beta-barrel family protein [Bacteroidales bacterium]
MDVFGKFAQIPTQADEQKGFSNQFQAGGGLGLKSGIGESADFLLSSYSTYNYHAATYDKEHFTQYVYQRTRLKISLLPWKQRILLQTDLSHNFMWKHYNDYKEMDGNDGFFLWNASAGYKFLKDRSLTLKASVHDILNQNRNIYQYTTSVYSESIKTNDLKRYFMLSVRYDLKR